MLTAKCRLCGDELTSPLIVTDIHKKAVAIGKLTVEHMERRHKEEMIEVVLLNRQFNGFVVMNSFIMGDAEVSNIMEETRDRLAEKIMQFSPEEEEDEDDEEADKMDAGDVRARSDDEDDEDIIDCPHCGGEIDLSEFLEEEVEETTETITEVIEEAREAIEGSEGSKAGDIIDVTPIKESGFNKDRENERKRRRLLK